MRRLSLFHTVEWLLRQKRRFSMPTQPMPDSDIPPAIAITGDQPSITMTDNDWHEAIKAASPLHALDVAPVNAKIVVVREQGATTAILALPSGEQVILGGDDPARGLPVGARIQKTADDEFVSSQLGATTVMESRVTSTGYDAVTGFLAYFHPTT